MIKAPLALVSVEGLSIGLDDSRLAITSDIALTVAPGETVGLVGESGSGKSTIALAMMGYLGRGLAKLEGAARFDGRDMLTLPRSELQALRGGKIALVPQNAGQSLSPGQRVGAQLGEALALHSGLPRKDWPARKIALLQQVRLPDPAAILKRYPHQLSGGQQQRVAIAMALAGDPRILILDEPTTGLDVTTQAHILDLLDGLRRDHGLAMIFVSHDMGVIARMCSRVIVLYAGRVAEDGPVAEVLLRPAHPYTHALLSAIPRLSEGTVPVALEGRPPAPHEAPSGCLFAPRCQHATAACEAARPPLLAHAGRQVACIHVAAIAAVPARPANPGRASPSGGAEVLAVTDLSVRYDRPGLLSALRPPRPATVAGVSLTIKRGETLALVGESGSGKSTILKAIAGLVPPAAGTMRLGGSEVLAGRASDRTLDMRRRVQMVFQNPDASLNPRQTVREILSQPLRLYENLGGKQLEARVRELVDEVRLGASCLDKLPRQMSGGEKQRIGIARAFAARPDLILCDEITSALDVSVQAAVLKLLADMQTRSGTALLFVSHDLAVVRAISDRVLVLYQGRLCEAGDVAHVFGPSKHPYSRILLGAVAEPVPGQVSVLLADDMSESAPPALGCAFQRRCRVKITDQCAVLAPPRRETTADHAIWCHHPPEVLATPD